MQVSQPSYQLPQYESALLKKQRQSKLLSPKVNHVHPEVNLIQKIPLQKHHLDDTSMKLALHYDYQENHLPKHYIFQGNRLHYDKTEHNHKKNHTKTFNTHSTNRFAQTTQANLKLNTEYFESQLNFNPSKPQKDQAQTFPQKPYQTQHTEQPSRLKKSISATDLETIRQDQLQMQQKVITKLNQIQTQTDRISQNIQNTKQLKSAYDNNHNGNPQFARCQSQTKQSSAEKNFNKLKAKLERQRTKEKQRLQTELGKIKAEAKKIKEQEKKRNKSFKQLIDKHPQNNHYLQNLILSPTSGNRAPINLMRTTDMNYASQTIARGQNDLIIGQKLNEIQRNYLPKTNIVNKRIQCEIYDPKSDHLRRLQQKPRFICNDNSDTDSQFSDL